MMSPYPVNRGEGILSMGQDGRTGGGGGGGGGAVRSFWCRTTNQMFQTKINFRRTKLLMKANKLYPMRSVIH